MNPLAEDPFAAVPVLAPVAKRKKPEPVIPAVPMVLGQAITVKLPYPPSANRYWRTRVVTTKAGPIVQTYPSADAKEFKEATGWILRAAGVRAPLTCRVHVHLQLWPHRPQDWATRARKDPLYWADSVQRLDLDNCRKVATDALKGIAIEDDRQVWRDSGEIMEPDGRAACLVLTIRPLLKPNPQGALL